MLERRLTGWLRPLLTLLSLAGMLSLAACGGGSGAPNNPYEPGPAPATPVSVLPASGVAYAGVPFTLTVSGGTAPYTALSSNPAILPVTQNVAGGNIVLLAANVSEDTPVNITVRDAGGQTTTVPITVRPALLLPASITIAGSPVCGGATLCSGQNGTATVRVTGPGGAGIAGRQVRFDVVQGTYSIQSTNPATPLVQTLTVATDQNGDATVALFVPPNAVSQLALIRATEVASGSQVTGQFTITQQVNGATVLSTIPTGKTTINGPYKDVCSAGVRVSHYIFGGTPPYRVALSYPDAATLVNTVVNVPGGNFDIITNGTCFVGLTPIITDATGLTLTSPPTIDNVPGTAAAPVPVQPLTVSPSRYPSTGAGACNGRTFQFTTTGVAPISVAASTTAALSGPIVVATSPINASPGTVNIQMPASVGAGNVIVTFGDASTPQQLNSGLIACNGT